MEPAVAGNTSDGVHIAAAGGVWQTLVFGFGGVRDHEGRLSITPRLPSTWRRLEFSLRHHDRQLRISLEHGRERYILESGSPLAVQIRDEVVELTAGRPHETTGPPAVAPAGP